jgi:hypothetical protein
LRARTLASTPEVPLAASTKTGPSLLHGNDEAQLPGPKMPPTHLVPTFAEVRRVLAQSDDAMVWSAAGFEQCDAALKQVDRENVRLREQLDEFRRADAIAASSAVAHSCNAACSGHICAVNFWFGLHFVARQSAEPLPASTDG